MKIKHLKLGATGHRPYGQLDETDEGELRLAVAADHAQGVVRIEFGTTVAWLGLPEAGARELAALLIAKADDLKARRS